MIIIASSLKMLLIGRPVHGDGLLMAMALRPGLVP